MALKTREDLELLEDAEREAELHHAKKQKPSSPFAPSPFEFHYQALSAKPAPGPKGPPTAELLEEAKRRRREREREEGGGRR